jgi:cell wall-associated NlpC family hydrolase
MKKICLAAVIFTFAIVGVQPASAAAVNGEAIAKGAPCFQTQFRDGKCESYVKKGSSLVLLPGGDHWYRHVIYNGKEGYVSAGYITVIKEPQTTSNPVPPVSHPVPPVSHPVPPVQAGQAAKVVEFAKSLQGKVSYSWGKNDSNNLIFDCSSFTKYVFKQAAGIDLKWGANLQNNQFSHKVAKTDLRPGDLIFSSVGTPGKIGHVGIYIGNGKMIHNLSPQYDVIISDITTGYWNNHFVTAARVF